MSWLCCFLFLSDLTEFGFLLLASLIHASPVVSFTGSFDFVWLQVLLSNMRVLFCLTGSSEFVVDISTQSLQKVSRISLLNFYAQNLWSLLGLVCQVESVEFSLFSLVG